MILITERMNYNYDFSKIESILLMMEEDHSSSKLNALKTELNRFFTKAKCDQILYTNNTDKLFFGMRVYPEISGNDAVKILQDEDKVKHFDKYFIELDSKIFDPMMGLDEKELTAMLLHEVGHIVYDTGSIDEVRKNIDMYFLDTETYLDLKSSESYRELMAYGIKDSVVKTASLFTKVGNEELVADVFVASCGYGTYLESGFRKILRSSRHINKAVDDRFIVLSWIIRLYTDVKIKRLPAIRTLNKAKELTGSKLEKREIEFAISKLNKVDLVTEGNAIDNVRERFNKKFSKFKAKGVRSLRDDIYELNLQLRTTETVEDAMYIIRVCNNDIAILQDYLTEPDIPDSEREAIIDTLEELYKIRQKAAKESSIRDKYSSFIQVNYPDV